ncbi:hypothetical protein P4S70_23035, partial [Enterovibrio sp. Hal110]
SMVRVFNRFRIYRETLSRFRAPLHGRAFRLPAVRATTWQVEVSGTAEIERIMVASSMQELA